MAFRMPQSRIVLTAIVLVLALLATGVASADTTVTVTPADVGSTWFENDTRVGGDSEFVSGPAAPPLGVGSLQMTTTDIFGASQAKAQMITFAYGSFGVPGAGLALADLTALSYWAYRSSSSTNPAAQTVSLNLEVDYAGTGASFTTLVFEPVYNPAQGPMLTDTWQDWDAYNGGAAVWWSTQSIPGVCAFTCYVSWATILANNPNARVRFGLGFNVGSGWVGQYSGAADALTVGVSGENTTYDFEPITDAQGPAVSDVTATPNPAGVGSPVTFSATADDSANGGSLVTGAQYSLDGGATWAAMSAADGAFDEVSEAVTAGAVAPAAAGIYDLCVRASDAAGNTGAASCALFVVFNPDGGFATGGGWIDVGGEHANVGFVAKYKNDGSLEGSTQFHHQAGDLNFQSTSYDWLVIAAGGASAELRGQGTVNGQMAPDGSSYQFTLSAGDGNPDTFRLRVWWLNNGVETVVFDNGASQPLGGGSIKIHQAN